MGEGVWRSHALFKPVTLLESPSVHRPPVPSPCLEVRGGAELKIPVLQSHDWFPWQPSLGAFQKLLHSHKLR